MPKLIDDNRNPLGHKGDIKMPGGRRKDKQPSPDEFNRQLGLARLRAELEKVRAFLPRRIFVAVIQEFGEEIEGILKGEG